MERRPPHVGTIADIISSGFHATIYCDEIGCRNGRTLDLDEISERYGRDMRVADFVGRNRCSKCGARWPKVSIRVAPINTGDFGGMRA